MTDHADISEFKALSARRDSCTIGRTLNDLPPTEATNLRAALAATISEVSHTGIQAWLAKRDIKIGTGPIKRHRGGQCCCDE